MGVSGNFMTRLLLILYSFLALISCTRTVDPPAEISIVIDSTSAPIKTSLAGQVYFYAPEIDSLTCASTGACDCCSGHIIFLNDTSFVSLDYCESETSYSKGSYHFSNNDLVIISDSISIRRQYNPARESDTTGKVLPEYLITDTMTAPYTQTLKRIVCKNSISFIMGDKETYYVTRDLKTSADDIIQTIKDDNIWDRLRIKNYR